MLCSRAGCIVAVKSLLDNWTGAISLSRTTLFRDRTTSKGELVSCSEDVWLSMLVDLFLCIVYFEKIDNVIQL